ncbi:hypothetical protein KL925_003213 [Ogataea polymorpha]|nr:hypothetical protein KL908_002860 [Ogataea polymorpha]KAG7905782.1 hypothetical protein KL907_002929 [Ogataea polymorpha]KAG7926928.1 hypothetical protein KL925_003213 [Ogataea polymorpha]
MAAPALTLGQILLEFFPTAAKPAFKIDQVPRIACDDDQCLAPEPANLAVAVLKIRQRGQHSLRPQREAKRYPGLLVDGQRAVVDVEQPHELRRHQSRGPNVHEKPKHHRGDYISKGRKMAQPEQWSSYKWSLRVIN